MMQGEEERYVNIRKKNERALQELSDSIRKSNIRIGIPEKEEGKGNREPIQTNSR